MLGGMRSLNLANAAAIAVYEAWRQLGHPGGQWSSIGNAGKERIGCSRAVAPCE